ncbi:CZB domain-containing protein [Salmonella enterica]|nr:CZB domain-containing protein [Salmonella enterica]
MKKLLSLINVLNAEVEEIRQSTIISSKVIKSSADSLLMIILKAQHYQWRELVYMFALSQSNHSIPQQDEFSCALGKWYNGQGKENFSHLPAFSLLGDYHSKFHRISADILKEGFNGISWEKVSRNLEEFEKCSNLVISALDQLDEQMTLYMILCKRLSSEVTVQAVTELDNKAAHRHTPVLQRHRPFL